MKRRILFLSLVLCLVQYVAAQSNVRPEWVDRKPEAGNSTYIYVVERGGGKTVTAAVNDAMKKVMQTTMTRLGGVGLNKVYEALQNGEDWADVAAQYSIPVNKVCQYVEAKYATGAYRVVVLCQVATKGNVAAVFDDYLDCNTPPKYNNGLAVLESALIPGLGQMSKRRYGSGFFTLLGEMAFVGGAVTTYSMAQQELEIMQKPDVSFNKFSTARKNYDNYRTAHIACISAAAVLYVFNLVRAGTITPRYKTDKLSFTPEIIPVDDKMAAGINLTLKF